MWVDERFIVILVTSDSISDCRAINLPIYLIAGINKSSTLLSFKKKEVKSKCVIH